MLIHFNEAIVNKNYLLNFLINFESVAEHRITGAKKKNVCVYTIALQ